MTHRHTFTILTTTLLAVGLTVGGASHAVGTQTSDQAAFSSLTADMIAAHAANKNTNLSNYLATTSLSVATPQAEVDAADATDTLPATASTPTVLSTSSASTLGLTPTPLVADTIGALETELGKRNVGITTTDTANIDALARAVQTKAADWDAIVTRAGTAWVSQLSDLHTTPLKAPSVPKAKVPKNALPFGLLVNKSIATMVKQAPAVLAAGTSGSKQAAPGIEAEWQKAMASTWAGSKSNLLSSVPDPCTGDMLTTMATGTASGSNQCSTGCVIGGLYLNQQVKTLFDPNRSSRLNNPGADVFAAQSVDSLPGWVRDTITARNPSLATLDKTSTEPCTNAATAAAGTAQRALPNVFSSLLR